MSSNPAKPANMEPAIAPCELLRQTERELQIELAKASAHPLEGIAFFRRWPRSFLRDLLYTIFFNAMFATGFTLIGILASLTSGRQLLLSDLPGAFVNNLLISNVIGFSFWGVMSLIEPVMRLVHVRGFLVVVMFYTMLGMAVVTGSFFVVSLIPGYDKIGRWLFTVPQFVSSFIISLIISIVMTLIWQRQTKELAAQIALSEERGRSEAAERAAAQANLRALQAQIEPHFLFNTLANVTSLIHTQPDIAKKMLEEFISYLRASLSLSREAETTLAKEFELMQGYLSVFMVRMGPRLDFAVDLPDEVKHTALPPMLIQPLVENAIKHGVEPNIDGGNIKLAARRVGDNIEIEVVDDGLGFGNTTSNGIGLGNVRERLEKIYGARASLVIQDNQPRGTRITILIPA